MKFKVLLSIFIVLLVLLIGFGAYLIIDFSQIWGGLGFDKNEDVEEYEIDPDAEGLDEVAFVEGNAETVNKEDGVLDILLIGVDNRSSGKFTGRSDVLMVLRIDTNTKELKLVSFMRDTLVEIEGHDKNRINTAYHFGSIELTYQTMKDSFGISPDYYTVVNFYGMEDIIDALGGVDINIESKEISCLNGSVDEINRIDSAGKVSHISSSGMQNLNGRQAVAYMRIRKVGGDAARVNRQQVVLDALFNKATSIDIGQIPSLISALAQYVRTDIPINKMLDIGLAVLGMKDSGLQRFSYPDEYDNGGYKGMSIVQPADYDTEMAKLVDFLENLQY